jgi:thymidine kinase
MDRKTGAIELVVGPMFSGKSTELLRRVQRLKAAHKSCLSLVYSRDCRYFADAAVIGTHDQQSFPARKVTTLAEVSQAELDAVQAVVIDEAQFFADLAHFARLWSRQGKHVVVAALNGDFRQEPFANVVPLYALATGITPLSAICTGCGADAHYSRRLSGGTELEQIGGAESYTALCGTCLYAACSQ